MSRPVAALALLLLGPAVAAAQARAPLAWKWQTGEQFTLSVATAYEEQITIAGKQLKNKAKTSIAFDVTVRAVARNGGAGELLRPLVCVLRRPAHRGGHRRALIPLRVRATT